jgi:hypothetical protein
VAAVPSVAAVSSGAAAPAGAKDLRRANKNSGWRHQVL